jgi:hypothetical protein
MQRETVMERAEKWYAEQRAKDNGDAHFDKFLSRARKALHEQLYKTEHGFDQEISEGL